MGTRRLQSTASTVALAMLLTVGAVLCQAPFAVADPVRVSFDFAFANLVPGQTQTGSWPLDLERDSYVSSAALPVDSHDLIWAVELCGPEQDSCHRVGQELVGKHLARGQYELRVHVTVTDQASQAADTRVSGSLAFAEIGPELGIGQMAASWTGIGFAGIAAATGVFFISEHSAHRSKHEEEES